MKRMEQFPAQNPNPVLSVGKDGIILYSNLAGEPLLHEWDVKVGEKVPSYIEDFVRRAILQNKPEKIEAKFGTKVYLISFHPLPEDECVNIYGFDISNYKELEKKLRKSESRELARSNELEVLLDAVPAAVWITHDPKALHISGNKLSYEWLRIPEGINASKSAPEGERPETFKIFSDGRELQPEEMPVQMSAAGKEIRNYEFDIVYPDSTMRHILGNASTLFDERGKPTGSISAFIDITERKKIEESLKSAYRDLEEKVRERTIELENAYNALKESERSLAEAQKMAHLGNWERVLKNGKLHWSDELYRIFGLEPQGFELTYTAFLNYVHPEDRDSVDSAVKKAFDRKPININYRIFSANGEERVVHGQGEVVFNENNIPTRIRGTVQDITARKKAEEAMKKIEITRQKEIHHRIKNNLQVISSLLDLQAEKFRGRGCINDSEVFEAFRESHDRVLSIALIHEELHEGEGEEALNFSLYLEKLVESLLHTYVLGNTAVNLNIDLEESVFFDMDIAVPLGMIVNELVSNSLKYAFLNRETGEVQIKLFSEKTGDKLDNNEGNLFEKSTRYTLIVSDNGVGVPETVDIKNSKTLGLQLVSILVDQLNGAIELKRDTGTEFIVKFITTKNL